MPKSDENGIPNELSHMQSKKRVLYGFIVTTETKFRAALLPYFGQIIFI
jgi:hypothetical protein